MDTLFSGVYCLECGNESEADLFATRCQACGGAWLEARYDCAALPINWLALLHDRPTDMWRYHELLPFPAGFRPVSMGEGWTPLTRAENLERDLEHPEIWIKDERQQPTGSFKDRQAAFAVSALKAQGIHELVLASTGNAAAAYAAYCARAGIKLWVFLNGSVPAEKTRELALYGAEVIKITGTYDQAKEIAADFAARRNLYKDQGAKAIPGKESMKTIALEIAEQLGRASPSTDSGSRGWRAPDWYVQAVSGGIGPLGVLKGFTELHQAGLIDRVPKLAIVQAQGCAPMVRAWEQNLPRAEPVQPDSLITVLSTGKPGLAYVILKQAIDRYGGAMIAVSDGEAFRAMRHIARLEGISTEPAASVAFAGLQKLFAQGYIRPAECVVVNCSGHTFSAEKHALEDRYVFELKIEPSKTLAPAPPPTLHPQRGASEGAETQAVPAATPKEGLIAALEQLDEQITTIVVIEDNPYDSRLIRRLLQNYKHYRIFEAYTGLDGLDLVRQRQPDLVILDLTLPDKEGLAILDELKADPRTQAIPVMIVSAKSLTTPEWDRIRRYTTDIWRKGSFSARDLVNHVVEILSDDRLSPTDQPARLKVEPANQPTDLLIPTFGHSERPRILIVDDLASDARVMRRLFEARQRFEVVEAHSGAEALCAIEQACPDLIILDLVLPDTRGEEVLETLRARADTRHVPVVVVSAQDIDLALRTQLTAQADSVWNKTTLDRSSLLAHVENILSE
jgi:threonine synthase